MPTCLSCSHTPLVLMCSHSLPQLRLDEKRILRGTMDGVRRRLAPIRGIPTKVGAGRGQ